MHWIMTVLLVMVGATLAEDRPMVIQDDALQRSLDYVRDLTKDCTLTDGYECKEVAEDDFLRPGSWEKMIPARYLAAWEVCHQDFRQLSELTEEQRELRHYKVGFTENDTAYVILLQGLQLPYIDENGKRNGIVSAVFGRSVKYWVDKQSLTIAQRKFL